MSDPKPTKPLREDADAPPSTGRDLLLRSLRKVLARRGYSGEKLEQRIAELQTRDFPRLAAAIARKDE